MSKKKGAKKKRRSFKGRVSISRTVAGHVRAGLSRIRSAKAGLTATKGYPRRAYQELTQAETRLAHLL